VYQAFVLEFKLPQDYNFEKRTLKCKVD